MPRPVPPAILILLVGAFIWSSLVAVVQAQAQDLSQVLYRFENRALTLGRFGAVAVFQERLFAQAANCASKPLSSYGMADGIVGAKTRQAIIDLQPCLNASVRVAVGADNYGAITGWLVASINACQHAATRCDQARQSSDLCARRHGL